METQCFLFFYDLPLLAFRITFFFNPSFITNAQGFLHPLSYMFSNSPFSLFHGDFCSTAGEFVTQHPEE